MIDPHIANILNHHMLNKRFPEKGKIFPQSAKKKQAKTCKTADLFQFSQSYALSKIYESVIHKSIGLYVQNFLFIYVSAYRKNYGSNDIFLILIEQ